MVSSLLGLLGSSSTEQPFYMAKLIWNDYFDTHGKWQIPSVSVNLPPFTKCRIFKQGGFVYVYLAEMRFTWRDAPVPPDEEGEIFHGRFERYEDKRRKALDALENKSIEVLKAHEGKVLQARVYRVDVKMTNGKETLIRLLNKEGIEGNANLIWEHKQPEGRPLVIGGSENEPAAEE